VKVSYGRRVFLLCNTLLMLFVIFCTLYPFYYSIIASFSDPIALSKVKGMLWLPIKPFTLDAYKAILSHPLIVSGFLNSILITVFGTFLNIVFTMLCAYFLALDGPLLKNIIGFMVVFTMYFSGGLVPDYLNVKSLGLMGSTWALIIPGLISTYNMIIMRTAFRAVPQSLSESAILDGASHITVLTRVMIPLCKATIAVLVLYYAVAHWNSWFGASIYLRDKSKYPLQLIARNFLASPSLIGAGAESARYVELLKYALVMIVSAPIIFIYPFIQKYFAKGVMIGAVKG